MNLIKLINGPYNNREIEDSGAVVFVMGIWTKGKVIGTELGEATYEPNEDRTLAFWVGNTWLGTLEEVIPVDE